jgi:hypothetical protein
MTDEQSKQGATFMLRNLFDNLFGNFGGAAPVIVALLVVAAIAIVWIVFRVRSGGDRKKR